MIHRLSKNKLILGHWIEDSRMNWMKHRIHDYTMPMDVIHIAKELGEWRVYFDGEGMSHIEEVYKKVHGEGLYKAHELQLAKDQIDNLLSRIDNLILFL